MERGGKLPYRQEHATSCLRSCCPHHSHADRYSARSFAGFHALGVDGGDGRAGFAARGLASLHVRGLVEAIERAIVTAKIEIAVIRAFGWKVFRDRTPLTSDRMNIHEAVYNLAYVRRADARAAVARGYPMTPSKHLFGRTRGVASERRVSIRPPVARLRIPTGRLRDGLGGAPSIKLPASHFILLLYAPPQH